MSVTLNSNYGAVVASKNLVANQNDMNKTMERLSKGKKTINARDDAAGIAIAGKMEAQIRALSTAMRHAKDGQALVGAAEGSMQEASKILQRMRELAVHAASGIATEVDKDYLNVEMSHLVQQIDSISSNSKFNQRQLLTGDQFTFYTDMNIKGFNITTVSSDISVTSLGVSQTTVSIGGGVAQNSLSNVVSAIDGAIASVSSKRASLGAVSNRFDHILSNLGSIIDNTVRSKGIMIDADFATETTNLTKSNVLQQGATSMLAQANAQKNLILTLFQQ